MGRQKPTDTLTRKQYQRQLAKLHVVLAELLQ